MKPCTKCKQEKPLGEFAFKNKAQGTLQSLCHPCRREEAKRSYQKHKGSVVAKSVNRGKQYRQDFRDYKSTLSCILCNESDSCCLDFHHLDPSKKDFVVSQMIHKRGRLQIQEELDKCVCLCSNCHRKVHANLICLLTKVSPS